MANDTSLPSFSYEVTIALLDGRRLAGDGDEIVFKEVGPIDSQEKIGFELRVANENMWWKGLILFEKDQSNSWEEVVAGDGKELPKYNEIPAGLLKTRYLALSKAKAAGVHSNVYNVTNADLVLQAGKKYSVMWNRD